MERGLNNRHGMHTTRKTIGTDKPALRMQSRSLCRYTKVPREEDREEDRVEDQEEDQEEDPDQGQEEEGPAENRAEDQAMD